MNPALITGTALLAQLTAPGGGGKAYIVHASACRIVCDDLPDLFKTQGVRFVLRDLRLAAGHLAHAAGVRAIVGAVPAAVLGNGHFLNTAAAVARAHLVLLNVAAASHGRHVTALVKTIPRVVA